LSELADGGQSWQIVVRAALSNTMALRLGTCFALLTLFSGCLAYEELTVEVATAEAINQLTRQLDDAATQRTTNLQTVLDAIREARGACHSCAEGWTGFEGSCFQVLPADDTMTWNDALRHCAVLAPCSRLATLLSAGEDAFVRDLLRERSIDTAYIGLWHEKNYSQESRNSTYRTQQEFSWFDGTKIEYSNWAGGEPNDWTDYQLAGFLRTSNGYWYDHFVDDVYLELGSSVTGVCKYVPTH